MQSEFRAIFPYGLLLITDEEATDWIPRWASDDDLWTSSSAAIVVRVQHGVDGPTTVRIWDHEPPGPGTVYVERAIHVKSGTVRISTATGEPSIRILVPPGSLGVKVIGSEPVQAPIVDVVLTPQGLLKPAVVRSSPIAG
jgi:hypothetical protein